MIYNSESNKLLNWISKITKKINKSKEPEDQVKVEVFT